MKCKECKTDKLSEEFPHSTISPACEHFTSWCLKCLVNYLKKTRNQHRCPICKAELTEQEFEEYCLLWDNANFKIDFESHLQTNTGQNNTNSEIFYVLTKYGICANSHIQLIVVLYSISKKESIKNLAFDLYWSYPDSRMDFLDGSCLIYKGDILWRTYDWSNLHFLDTPSMNHSGDILNYNAGHHRITAKLDSLPKDVTQLYLILSSQSSPTISHFRNPSFKLYDQKRPNKCLCNYNIHKANDSQAVIMCLINRSHDNWYVIEV
ncbi:4881_t:CDS:2, partial [Cetraspora pellucida]